MNRPNNIFTPHEIKANHDAFMQREAVYKQYGFEPQKARQNIIEKIDSDSSSVLELGTGKGHLTVLLAQNFAGPVVSVDIDHETQRMARVNAAYYGVLDKIDFVTSDISDLDHEKQGFDTVVSSFTFHHLDAPFKVIREMIRVAKNQIVISDFSDKGFDIIDRIHASEGKAHSRGSSDFSIVGAFLKEFNFKVSRYEDEWQVIYSAMRK